jgi:HSP20 family protein
MKNNQVKKGTNLVDSNFFDFYNMMENYFEDKWWPKAFKGDLVKLDIEEKDNEYLIEAEVPGFKKEEVEVVIKNETLMINAKHQEAKEVKEKNFIHQERSYNELHRSVYLPNALEAGIKAKLENGVLHLTVPKIHKVDETKKIKIE